MGGDASPAPPYILPQAAGTIPAAVGIGLRLPHAGDYLDAPPQHRPAWIEVHAETFMTPGGPRRALLEAAAARQPLSLHGVGLSLGSADGIDPAHLARLGALVAEFRPPLVSEHLAWSVADGVYLNDLLPLPLNLESLRAASDNISRVQDRLGRPILIENPSAYIAFAASHMPEPEFLAALVAATGCGLLLDVNNIVVATGNLGGDPMDWIETLPADAIGEIHIAGHSLVPLDSGAVLRIDDHGSAPGPAARALLRAALRRFGPRPVLLEWDTDLPDYAALLAVADSLTAEIAADSTSAAAAPGGVVHAA